MPTRDRFSRQIRFAPFGADGQSHLGRSTALLVGVGALGTHVAEALVRAGVGRLILVDRDIVELDNLQRQVLFDERDAADAVPKAIAAARRLRAISSAVAVEPVVADFDAATFGDLKRPDILLDGTDNFATRYVLNDLSLRETIPWIYGGAVGATGRAMVVLPGETPCLRCLMPEAPPTFEIGTCETEGILAPVVAHVAAFQTAEAMKILGGQVASVTRGVFAVDVWNGRWSVSMRNASPVADCKSCGTRRILPALRDDPHRNVALCGRDAVQVRPRDTDAVDLEVLAERMRGVARHVELNEHLLRFTAEGCRFAVFRGGRALLFGVDTPTRARALYDRYVGAP